jgi:hypothetical protein
LKQRANVERGWLFKARYDEIREVYLVAACSVGMTLQDIWEDYRYLNRPAIHVTHTKD